MQTRKYMPMIVQIGSRREIKQMPIPFFISNFVGNERIDKFIAAGQKQMEAQLGITPTKNSTPLNSQGQTSPNLGIFTPPAPTTTKREYGKNTTLYTEKSVIKNPKSLLPADMSMQELSFGDKNDTAPTSAFGGGDIFRVVLLIIGLLFLAKLFLL